MPARGASSGDSCPGIFSGAGASRPGVLEIIGIHTPETDAEHDPANVAKKVKELGITYPVLLDPDRRNWNRWQQRYWPAICLVDKRGQVRYCWEGELEYQGASGNVRMMDLIESLLNEQYPE